LQWFAVFGAKPYLGRTFQPEEDLTNADPVVVLAHATWKRLFGGNTSVLGQVIELNQRPYRIVGVMGPEFRWPRQVDIWAPAGLGAEAFREPNRFNESYFTVARMNPGVSLQQANSLIQVLADRVRSNGTQSGAYAKAS